MLIKRIQETIFEGNRKEKELTMFSKYIEYSPLSFSTKSFFFLH